MESIKEMSTAEVQNQHRATVLTLSSGEGKRVAFTLAEVLITLGIIGVVAALTIGSVVNNIQKKELQVGLKSAYSVISQAILNFKMEDGDGIRIRYRAYNENDGYYMASEFYDKFFQYSQIKNVGKCYYPNPIRNFTNTQNSYTSLMNFDDKPQTLMANGMCVGIYINAWQINISVDVNGTKRPNRLGYDIFYFTINDKDVLTPRKMEKLYTDEELENMQFSFNAGLPCSTKSNQRGNGVGCAYYALNDINPDDETKPYWKTLK